MPVFNEKNKGTLQICTLIFLFSLTFIIAGCGDGVEEDVDDRVADNDRIVINYGHVPSVATSEKYDQLLPLRNYLEAELPVEFNIRFAEDYNAVIDKVKGGEYDFVTFGPLSYVVAAAENAVEAVLKPMRHGQDSYQSLIIAHKYSGFESVEDLRNKSFGFVDHQSASGYLFPRAYMQREGIDIDNDLNYSFLNNHVNVVVNVWLQNYDAGAIYDDAREHMDNREMIMEETEVIARTPAIPNEPWAISRSFREKHPELVEEIVELMKNLHREGPRGKRVLDSLNIDGFSSATDEDYEIIREYQEYLPEVDPR